MFDALWNEYLWNQIANGPRSADLCCIIYWRIRDTNFIPFDDEYLFQHRSEISFLMLHVPMTIPFVIFDVTLCEIEIKKTDESPMKWHFQISVVVYLYKSREFL